MAVRPWVGGHRFAIVPVFNRQVDREIPSDWEYKLRRRMFYHPDAATGLDRSFQHYLHALSYGRAFLDGQFFPPVWSDDAEVNIPAMESLPEGHGYTDLIVILPHSFGQHRGGWAFMDVSPVNGITSWARIAMFDDRDMTRLQPLGVWAMEILHVATRMGDLYNTQPNLAAYDVMADAGATAHASAHTKSLFGWLPEGRIIENDGAHDYVLHPIGLSQPPPPGRVTAVKIPSLTQERIHFMVEARMAVDQFERKDSSSDGLPGISGSSLTAKEGVIVYEVRSDEMVFLRSGMALGVGEEYVNVTEDESIRLLVKEQLEDGFVVAIDVPGRPWIDRTKQFATPAAARGPAAVFVASRGDENITYCDEDGRLHELWRDSLGQTGTSNLTELAQAPKCAGSPFTYVDTTTNQVILLYRADGGHVHSLYWSTGGVGHDNLTGSVNAPKAAGNPVGYFTPATNTNHVIYRRSNGHLEVLWWAGAEAVNFSDATALAAAPLAAGDPSAYVDTTHGMNIVAYRAKDGNIRSIYWSDGPMGHDDLSGVAGTAKAAGDPAAYYTAHNDCHQVTYRSIDGHIIELSWLGQQPVVSVDLTAILQSEPAASDPIAFYCASNDLKHVCYRTADGRFQEFRWRHGSDLLTHIDLNTLAQAPKAAAGKPAGFTLPGRRAHRLAYRGAQDNHIHEIRWAT